MSEKIVDVASLGICEHCGCLVCIQDFPMESMDAEWVCPKCKKSIGHETFGFNVPDKGAKKVRWVGKDGKWQENRPNEDFTLGNWHVVVQESIPNYH